MAILNLSSRTSLGSTCRLDAEYFLPERLLAQDTVSKFPRLKSLNQLTTWVTQGPNPKFSEYGMICLNGKNVYFGSASTGEPNYVTSEELLVWKDYQLRSNDIVITLKHATRIGRAWIITDNEPKIFTRNLGLIRLMPRSQTNAATLLFYLWSQHAQLILDRLATGGTSGQITLATSALKRMPVPILCDEIQLALSGLLGKYLCKTGESHERYAQAEQLLLAELGLQDWKPAPTLAYTRNYSQAARARRIDAEHFQPAFDEVEQHLRSKYDAQEIGRLKFMNVTTGQYCTRYVDRGEGQPYIRGTDIANGTISLDELVSIPNEQQFLDKKAKEGDVVVTRVGTIGLVARIPKECEGGTISDNLIRLRFNKERLDSYYLTLYLGSQIGKGLMMKHSRGSVQRRLNQETLKYIVVPILPSDKQRRISMLVQQSHAARQEAEATLLEAKRAVEIAIEDGEDKAIEFIAVADNAL